MKISVACDHGALDLKNAVKVHLETKGIEVVDFGCHTLESCDYPDMIAPAAQAVANGQCDKGIVLCTTGIGASITANVMALGAGIVGKNLALEIVDVWVGTEFSGDERHQRRINKMMAIEG